VNRTHATPPVSRAAQPIALSAVTLLITVVVALSFLFGLGNVWALGTRLGVPTYIAPLVAPAVDLSVIALLVATRQLAIAGAQPDQIRPAQRLLIFCSLVTLALNTAEPILEGHYGRAAFDAVGCTLLIGWSHIAPDLLQALHTATTAKDPATRPAHEDQGNATTNPDLQNEILTPDISIQTASKTRPGMGHGQPRRSSDPNLVHRARVEDARHWEMNRRPISAETLRRRLGIGTRTARDLVTQLRSDSRPRIPDNSDEIGALPIAAA